MKDTSKPNSDYIFFLYDSLPSSKWREAVEFHNGVVESFAHDLSIFKQIEPPSGEASLVYMIDQGITVSSANEIVGEIREGPGEEVPGLRTDAAW